MDAYTRIKVIERDNYTCRYCGNTSPPFHADHVYPYSKGGETSINNMVTACQRCNVKKGSKVGIYPKPIGYFKNKDRVIGHVIHNISQEASLIFTSLLLSGFCVFIAYKVEVPFERFWIYQLALWVWFLFSIVCAIQWITTLIKMESK